jgi:nicotine blue oxidoreductase
VVEREGFAGLVLAAGEGRRFGGPKAPVVIEGERLVDRAVRCLADAGCSPVIVVLGAWVGDVPGAQVLVNGDWAEGMGTSLRTGLLTIETEQEISSVVVTLVDLPGMTSTAVRRVIDADASIAMAAYGGEPGHPVRIDRAHWAGVLASVSGDSGARAYLRGRDDVLLVEVGDVADGRDLDTPTH